MNSFTPALVPTILALVASAMASATTKPPPQVPQASASSVSQSHSASTSAAEQVQYQTQWQDQDQNQTQGQQAVALNEGNNNANSQQSSNTTNVTSTYKQIRQAPGATTSASDTTANCQKDRRVGVSSVVGGLSFGASRTDRDCRLLERADYEESRGNVSASIRLRCATTVYREALGEDCEALLSTPVPVRPTATDQAAREKRILEKAVQK
jgi:hypothetical protein